MSSEPPQPGHLCSWHGMVSGCVILPQEIQHQGKDKNVGDTGKYESRL